MTSDLTVPFSSTLSHKRNGSGRKVIERKIYVLSLQLLSDIFLILRRTERDIVINIDRSLCKRYSCHILTEFEFSRNIFEILRYRIS